MQIYVLMHKNIQVAEITLDDSSERILKIETRAHNPESGPFLGNLTLKNMNIWWKNRSIPGNREDLRDILEASGCVTAGDFLAKNLALSLTDTYWIRPINTDVTWEDVNLYGHMYSENLKMHNENSYHAGSSLNGQMRKYWERIDGEPIENWLVKQSTLAEGQLNINEAFASVLHDKQELRPDLDYVKYMLIMQADMCVGSKCKAFTNASIELVYATDILYGQKDLNDESMYEKFIRVSGELGLDANDIRTSMEYMLLTDFIMGNRDRHMNNFGLLRNADTMQYIGFAPLYDTGNAMFYDSSRVLERYELLAEPITSFTKTSADSLKYIHNRNVLCLDKLPSETEVRDFYSRYGVFPLRAAAIATNFINKVALLDEFQHGKDFSLYQERMLHKEQIRHTVNPEGF